jgi:hypothetical protein
VLYLISIVSGYLTSTGVYKMVMHESPIFYVMCCMCASVVVRGLIWSNQRPRDMIDRHQGYQCNAYQKVF